MENYFLSIFGRKVQNTHMAVLCVALALVSATLFWFFSSGMRGDVTSVLEATGLVSGRQVFLKATLSSATTNQYGAYSSLACDYSGCIKCNIGKDLVPYTLASKPVLITGKIHYTSGFSKSLDVTKIEFEN